MTRVLFVCQNDRGEHHPKGSCRQKGSDTMLKHMKSVCKQHPEWAIRATSSGCLGRCEKGPVCVLYPDDQWKTIDTTEQADEWLTKVGSKVRGIC